VRAEHLYEKAVLDPRLRRIVGDAITWAFREDFVGIAAVGKRPDLTRRMPLGWAAGLVVAGLAGGHVLAAATTTAAKMSMAASWAALLFCGWGSGRLFRYREKSRFYAAHWIFFTLSWWAIHELVATAVGSEAHFLGRIPLAGPLAGGVLTVASALVIGLGLSKRGKALSRDSQSRAVAR